MSVNNLPEYITIDRYKPNDKGEIWYHLGNYYWLDENKEFYKWLSTLNPKFYESEEDFPHSYFRFLTDVHEQEFLYKWGHRVEDSPYE